MLIVGSSYATEIDNEEFTTDYYLSYDLDNSAIMYSKNLDKRISQASLTKLMTALILYESFEINEKVNISIPDTYTYDGKVAYLKDNELLSVEQLLKLLLIYSANDAAYAVANLVSEDVDSFVTLMNTKAKQLEMNNTKYTNPDGLDEDGQFTTLNDLLKLSIYILENTRLLAITKESSFTLERDNINQKYESTNYMIDSGFIGLKTGWTSKAGLTFIGFNQNSDRNILTIVNNSVVDTDRLNHFNDTKIIYQLSLDNFKNYEIISIDSDIYSNLNYNSSLRVQNEKSFSVFGEINNKVKLFLNDYGSSEIEFLYNDAVHTVKIKNTDQRISYNFIRSNIISRFFP